MTMFHGQANFYSTGKLDQVVFSSQMALFWGMSSEDGHMGRTAIHLSCVCHELGDQIRLVEWCGL